jgi:hypothetical protein
MAKQLKTRWVLGGAVVSITALSIAGGWYSALSGVDRIFGTFGIFNQDKAGGLQAELLFLKAALDRLDADARQTDPDSPVLRSLRAEQDAVTLRIREVVARTLPTERVPRELRLLANEEARAAESTLTAGSASAGGSVATAAVLKVGLESSPPIPELNLSRDPALNLVVLMADPALVDVASGSEAASGIDGRNNPAALNVEPGSPEQTTPPRTAIEISPTSNVPQQRGPGTEALAAPISPNPKNGTALPEPSPAKKAGLGVADQPMSSGTAPSSASNEQTPAVSRAPMASAAWQEASSTEIAALVARGDEFLAFRDVNSARLFYERAAAAGNGRAALHMGVTFDPTFLARMGLHGAYGHPGQAASWYRRAAELGEIDAEELYNRVQVHLGGQTSKN